MHSASKIFPVTKENANFDNYLVSKFSHATHQFDWAVPPVANAQTIHRHTIDLTRMGTIDFIDRNTFPEHEYYLFGSGGGILHFAGLEELRVSLNLSEFYWACTSNTDKQQMERTAAVNIRTCLDENKKLFTTGKAPVVKAVTCKRDLKR